MSSPQEELYFVTWNTRGIKKTRASQWLDALSQLKADIAFIQETHVGPEDYSILENVEGWKVYFTVYNPRSKGVAILIRDEVPFEYICHDEDHSGSYIVLFCHLYGELYTLVNVYNHKNDNKVLNILKEYLQETAEGVLVVGGDFNTVLDPNFDRQSFAGHTGSSSLRSHLEDFTWSLQLRDTWTHLHPSDFAFTRCEKNSNARLDMFFMPEDTLRRVSGCEIDTTANNTLDQKKISDHDPLVLTLRVQQQSVKKTPNVASMLEESEHSGETDRRSEKIRGAEILSAIKSFTNSEEDRPDKRTVNYYKKCRCPLSEVLKIKYNQMLNTELIPEDFTTIHRSGNDYIFNVDYMILCRILAERLKVFITPSFRRQKKVKFDHSLVITIAESTNQIKRSFLEKSLENLKSIQPAPPCDFNILKHLLPEVSGSSGELFLNLQQGCPLTSPILTLALNHLKDQILTIGSRASICHFRQAMLIDIKTNEVERLMEQFMEDSGISLEMQLNNAICP